MNKEELEDLKEFDDYMDKYIAEHSIRKRYYKEEYVKKLEQENKKYKEVIDKAIKCVYYNTKYRNGADIYQFVDIESEILEPLQDILEQNDNSNNAYLKEFNDWLKEVK